MKRYLFILLFLVPYAEAQTPQVDSLSAALEAATDTTRIRLLNELTMAFRQRDPDQALAVSINDRSFVPRIESGVLRMTRRRRFPSIAYAKR